MGFCEEKVGSKPKVLKSQNIECGPPSKVKRLTQGDFCAHKCAQITSAQVYYDIVVRYKKKSSYECDSVSTWICMSHWIVCKLAHC